jgi:DNA repair exonuclease SbcCD nuclease subunit
LPGLKIEPNPKSRYNVLTVHGTLEGIARNFYDVLPPITRAQVMGDGWDYVAFGHYHMHEKLADNAYYAGSLEYTSFNIWQETDRAKGFVEFDLDARQLVGFHKTHPREVVDLRVVDADGLSAAELNGLIQLRVEGIKGAHADKIVRLVVENAPRAILADLDYRAIRQIRSEALHFDLHFRPPSKAGAPRAEGDSATPRPLEEEWREFAGAYDVPGGVGKGELVTKGLEYLGADI